MKKRVLALILTFTMVLSLVPMTGFATGITDMPTNWSTLALEKAVANELLKGDNGKIRPGDSLTRAEMATIVNRAFNAVDKASLANFSDVLKGKWNYDEMAKAIKMGTFLGNGNKLNPDQKITREEAFVVLARAFKIADTRNVDTNKFIDGKDISSWAQKDVLALASAGYIAGSNGQINPKKEITRAEFAKIMDNLVSNYIVKEGEYTKDYQGNVMINRAGVTLKGITISGDLTIGDGVGDGEVTLDNVTLTGRMVVRGGGENSIKIIGKSNIKNIIIARVDGIVRVYTEDGVEVGEVTVDGTDDVILEGDFKSVILTSKDITVMAKSSNINSALVLGENSKIIVDKESVVLKVTVNAKDVTIEGKGTIKEVVGNSDRLTVTVIGTKVTASEEREGINAGDQKVGEGETKIVGEVKPTNPPSTGDSNSGDSNSGGNSDIAVTGITVTGVNNSTTITAYKGTLQMNAAVLPSNATNKAVTWSITNGTSFATINGSGLLSAVANGTVTVKATAKDGSEIFGSEVIIISNQLTTSPLSSFEAVTLTQTGDVANNNVQYQNSAAVIAALPTTISVTLVSGSKVNVPVTWTDTNNYNAGVASSYTFTATWGTMPVGANNANNLAAPTVVVKVNQGTVDLVIVAVSAITVTSAADATTVVNGGTLQMSAAVAPANATNKTITWSVATLVGGTATINSTTGLLTATGLGTVTVTATNAASGVKGSKTITVSPAVAPEILIDDWVTYKTSKDGVEYRGVQIRIQMNEAEKTKLQDNDIVKVTILKDSEILATSILNARTVNDIKSKFNSVYGLKTDLSATFFAPNVSYPSGSWTTVWNKPIIVKEDHPTEAKVEVIRNEVVVSATTTIQTLNESFTDGISIIAFSWESIFEPESILVSAISVTGTGNATTITTYNGTLQMLANVQPADATNKTVTWSVTDGTGSATISVGGLLTAVTDGTITVKATSVSTGTVSGSKEITISNQLSPSTIVFSNGLLHYKAEGNEPFKPLITGGFGDGAITYSSSNPAVATVVETTGVVTIIAAGTTVITVTKAAMGRWTAVTVNYTLIVSQSFRNPETELVQVGEANVKLTYWAGEEIAADVGETIVWLSSHPAIATINHATGVISAVAAGGTIISYEVTKDATEIIVVRGSCLITVYEAATIANPEIGVVQVGGGNVTPTGFRAASAPETITWLSSDTAKATIDPATGVISAVAAGDTTISYKVTSGIPGFQKLVIAKGELAITVVAPKTAAVKISATGFAYGTIDFSIATKIILNEHEVTLTNVKALGSLNAQQWGIYVAEALQLDIDAVAALNGKFTVKQHTVGNKLVISTVAKGAGNKVTLGDGGQSATGTTLLGFTNLDEVEGQD